MKAMSDMQALRERINAIDSELIPLFVERMRIAGEIGEYKRINSLPVVDAAREALVIERAVAAAPEDMAELVRDFTSQLIRLAKERQGGDA